MRYELLDVTHSTNEYIKENYKNNEGIVVAKSQTHGKGTKGRSFVSSMGGLYLSKQVLNACKASDAFKIMINSAVAVVKTLKAFDIDCGIKWPNDIYASNKKICGMLIENTISGQNISRSIVGIGINVNNEIATDLKDIAISMCEILEGQVNLDSVIATLIFNLENEYSVDEYIENSLVIGKDVSLCVLDSSSVIKARVKAITDDGRLELDNGKIYSYGEIKLNLLNINGK